MSIGRFGRFSEGLATDFKLPTGEEKPEDFSPRNPNSRYDTTTEDLERWDLNKMRLEAQAEEREKEEANRVEICIPPCTPAGSTRGRGMTTLPVSIVGVGLALLLGLMGYRGYLDIRAAAEAGAVERERLEQERYAKGQAAEEERAREQAEKDHAEAIASLKETLKSPEGQQLLASLQEEAAQPSSDSAARFDVSGVLGADGGSLQDCTDNVVIAGMLGVGIRGNAKDLINLSDGLRLSFGSHYEAKSFYSDGSVLARKMFYDDSKPMNEGLQNLANTVSLGNNAGTGVRYLATGDEIRLKSAKRIGRAVNMAVGGLDPEAMYLLEVRGRKTMYFLFSTARHTSDVTCLNN